jgi:hypothetical protein
VVTKVTVFKHEIQWDELHSLKLGVHSEIGGAADAVESLLAYINANQTKNLHIPIVILI